MRTGRCISCGLCAATFRAPGDATRVSIVYDDAVGYYRPRVDGWVEGSDPGAFVCPGERMDMPALSMLEYGAQPDDAVMGRYVAVRAVQSTDRSDRKLAASGGAIPAILRHLFTENRIDAAYCVVQEPGRRDGIGRLIRSVSEIGRIHGSFYHPPDFGHELPQLFAEQSRFAFVGLPCQVAGLRMAMAADPALRRRCVAVIAAFCGGYNTFRGIAWYLERFGVAADEVAEIRYRDGAWPGTITVQTKDGRTIRDIPRVRGNTRWGVLRYLSAFQGSWMLKRCRICPDQIGDFADIAVGDPHLPRFRMRVEADGGAGWSAMLTRTETGERLVREIVAKGGLCEEPLSRDELVASQSYTLDNRRQAAVYARVERWFGGTPPRLSVYAGLRQNRSWRHYLYAVLDLGKLRIPTNGPLRAVLPFWQAFEYLFLRFPLMLTGQRLLKLLRNR